MKPPPDLELADAGLSQDHPAIALMRLVGSVMDEAGCDAPTAYTLLLNLAGVYLARWNPPNRRKWARQSHEIVAAAMKRFAEQNPGAIGDPGMQPPAVH